MLKYIMNLFEWWYGSVSYVRKFSITLFGFAIAIALGPTDGVIGIIFQLSDIHPYFFSIVLIALSLYLLFFYKSYFIPFWIFTPLTLYTIISITIILWDFNFALNAERNISFVPIVLYSSLSDIWISIAYRENKRMAAKG